MDARYEHLRHAALHARGEAFGLGFAVLTRHGVAAWHHTVTELAAGPAPARPAGTGTAPATPPALPAGVAAELVAALAALAGTTAAPTRTEGARACSPTPPPRR